MNTLFLALALLGAPQLSDDALKAQAKSALDATGLKYTASASGKSHMIVFDHTGNRKQTVYFTQAPSRVSTLVTYSIYTTCWVSTSATPPDEALMHKVLSKVKKLGTFYLFKDPNNVWAIRFGIKFDATDMKEAPSASDELVKALKDAIYLVNAVGEETDKELNGEKDIR